MYSGSRARSATVPLILKLVTALDKKANALNRWYECRHLCGWDSVGFKLSLMLSRCSQRAVANDKSTSTHMRRNATSAMLEHGRVWRRN